MSKPGIKFLIDVGVGKKVENLLHEFYYDIKSVREIDYRMKDKDILNIANKEERMIITMDKDFGELIFNTGLSHFGVLLLRLDDADGEEKVRIMKEILENHVNDLKNNFCVYQNSRFRIKKTHQR